MAFMGWILRCQLCCIPPSFRPSCTAWDILHRAARSERSLLSASTFSSQLLLNFTCWEKIIFLPRQSQRRYHGKREEDRREEESKFQKACQKWGNLSTDTLLGAFCMAQGRWRKHSGSFSLASSSFSLTSTDEEGGIASTSEFINSQHRLSADGYPERKSGIGIQGKRHEICALQGNMGHPGMKAGTRVSTWLHLEVCTAPGPMN